MSKLKAEVGEDRKIDVTRSGGYQWYCHFPDAWTFGAISHRRPAEIKIGKEPDRAFPDLAAMYAVEKARREHWVP